MNLLEVIDELRALGKDSIKKVHLQHGAHEPCFGVKVEDLKKLQKQIKVDHSLALELYDTGISDAMYLAGLIADDARMAKKDLQRWAKQAYWSYLSEYTVPWVAAGSAHGWELALEWIDSKKENVAASGWSTLSSLVSIKPDKELDLPALKKLLERARDTVHEQPNRVRYTMNGFVIALGAGVKSLTAPARAAAKKIGAIKVDMNGTACKVPSALEYLKKIEERGSIGKKRKTAKC